LLNSNGTIAKITDALANMINGWAGVSEAKSKAVQASNNKTDKILFNLATELAEKGTSKEDIKKELEKKIAERRKYLEE
jgi:hypothetical protein